MLKRKRVWIVVGLLAVALVHFFCVLILRRLPRFVAAGLVAGYGLFVYQGFLR